MNRIVTGRGIAVFAGLALAASGGLLVAGPLAPPAGPVVSSYKTLSEVEPRIALSATSTPGSAIAVYAISSPGSYYLTGDLAVPAGKAGILVQAPNVTLDLNGFRIAGGAYGVQLGAGTGGWMVVKNGHIFGSSLAGVEGTAGAGCRYEGLTITVGNAEGLNGGPQSVIEKCSVKLAGSPGILAPEGSAVRQCTVETTGGVGIWIPGAGVVAECTVKGGTSEGIRAGGSGATISHCSVTGANTGIFAGNGANVVESCTAYQNTLGFWAGESIVRNCVAEFSAMQGFRIGNGCTLSACRAIDNGTSGTYANIWVEGSGNRVEDNACIKTAANSNWGLWVDGTDNFIVKNTSRGHGGGNYSNIPAGNEMAPIVVNPGTNGFSTMTPWSNVSH